MNPVRAKIVQSPEAYPWSSYLDYIGQRKAPDWLHRSFILDYFGAQISKAQRGYRDFVRALVDQQYASPLDDVFSSVLLGGADFITFVKANYLAGRKPDNNLPSLKQLTDRATIQSINAEVENAFTGSPRLARSIKLYLCQKYTRLRLKDIGAHFGIGESGVCQATRRIKEMAKTDRSLKKNIKALEKKFVLLRMKT